MRWLRHNWTWLLVLLLAVLAIWFILSWSSDAGAATKPRKDAFPLHYNSSGPRVRDAKWLLAGNNRHGIVTFRGDLKDLRYTLAAGEAAKKMRFKLGYTKQGRGFDPTLRSYLVPIKNGGKPLPKAYAKRKAQRRSDAWPLRYGSSGERVRDAVYLLSGHNRWKIRTYHGKLTRFYSLDLAKAACLMKWRVGYPPNYFENAGQRQIAICRRFGENLRGYLTGQRSLPDKLWRTRIKLRTPKPKPKPALRATRIINYVIAGAEFAYQHRYSIVYTQGGSRWMQIHERLDMPPSIARYSDCSSFVSGIWWSALRRVGISTDLLNGLNWSGGFTGTLASHGLRVPASSARAGDVVIYGYAYPYSHTAQVVAGHGYSATVISHGSDPIRKLSMFYRHDVAMVRRYVQ